MFNGKIMLKNMKAIEGSYRQLDWSDESQSIIPIEYDGELTPEVCNAAVQALQKHINAQPQESSYGKLRWSTPDVINGVDVEQRGIIVTHVTRITD